MVREPAKPPVSAQSEPGTHASNTPSRATELEKNAAAGAAAPDKLAQQIHQSASRAAVTDAQMRFHIDKDTGKTVAALVDANGHVMRQVPSEEALELAKAIGRFQGLFVNRKA